MKPSTVLLLIMLAGCAAPEGGHAPSSTSTRFGLANRSGTEVCLGCRLEREVRRAEPPVVLSEKPSACSEWVAQNIPSHEHAWTATGCWWADDGSVSCLATPRLLHVSNSDWLEYLLRLPEPQRTEVVIAATQAKWSDQQQLLDDCRTLLSQDPAKQLPYLELRLEARPYPDGSKTTVTIYLEGVGGSVSPNGPPQLTLNGQVVYRPFPVWWDIGNWGPAHPKPLGRYATVVLSSSKFVEWLGGHGAFVLQARAGSDRSNEIALAVAKSGKTVLLPE